MSTLALDRCPADVSASTASGLRLLADAVRRTRPVPRSQTRTQVREALITRFAAEHGR